MGYAQIAFPNGPGIKFRIDPTAVDWSFKINASVTPTVGGRVVQVTGATLSDITIAGLFGEDHSQTSRPGADEHAGTSWQLAVRFSDRIRRMMNWQANDALDQGRMQPSAVFTYAPRNWRFRVYLKDFRDPDGGAINIRPEKFSHGYQLTLFVVQGDSDQLSSTKDGVLSKARSKAIDQYISRISDGIGWKPSKYNGDFGTYYDDIFGAKDGASASKAAPSSLGHL